MHAPYYISMNKKYIPGVIIVEGSHDVAHVSTLYESVFVITNGYEIPQKEINFLKALKEDVQIIVLTDNDKAGEEIRKRINDIRNNMINVVINAPENKKKKGIAECELKDIEKALDKYVSNKEDKDDIDLYELGLMGEKDSKIKREYIADKFNLGLCSKDNMIKRIKLLGITKEELERELHHAFSR